MARYKASTACWLKPDGHSGARRIEPGEEFGYSGTPSLAMISLDAYARAAKRRTLPDSWPVSASPAVTMRVAMGLGAHVTSNLAERRQTIDTFIRENPITEERAA